MTLKQYIQILNCMYKLLHFELVIPGNLQKLIFYRPPICECKHQCCLDSEEFLAHIEDDDFEEENDS
jgi:hypothetical protein